MLKKIIFFILGYTKRRTRYRNHIDGRLKALEEVKSPGTRVWITLTLAYIKEIFGDKSPEYHYMNEFAFSDPPEKDEIEGSEKRKKQFLDNKPLAKEFLEGCRRLVDDKRLYVPPYENFLSKMDGKALTAWITLIGGILITVSLMFGRYLGDKDFLEMKGSMGVLKEQLKNAHQRINDQDALIKKLDQMIPSPFGSGVGTGLILQRDSINASGYLESIRAQQR